MGLAKLKSKISVTEYIEGENLSEIRHEYIYGEVYAMAGGSTRHNRIVNNIGYQIDNRLRNSSCETFTENVKLRADEQTFYYPDVMVDCDKVPPSAFYREKPVLLVEVLSPSTERIDRNEKLTVYKTIPTLIEYLIVSQEKMSVEVHRKLENGEWQTEFYDEINDEIRLDSIDFNLSLSEIYRRVDLTPQSAEFPQ